MLTADLIRAGVGIDAAGRIAWSISDRWETVVATMPKRTLLVAKFDGADDLPSVSLVQDGGDPLAPFEGVGIVCELSGLLAGLPGRASL